MLETRLLYFHACSAGIWIFVVCAHMPPLQEGPQRPQYIHHTSIPPGLTLEVSAVNPTSRHPHAHS